MNRHSFLDQGIALQDQASARGQTVASALILVVLVIIVLLLTGRSGGGWLAGGV